MPRPPSLRQGHGALVASYAFWDTRPVVFALRVDSPLYPPPPPACTRFRGLESGRGARRASDPAAGPSDPRAELREGARDQEAAREAPQALGAGPGALRGRSRLFRAGSALSATLENPRTMLPRFLWPRQNLATPPEASEQNRLAACATPGSCEMSVRGPQHALLLRLPLVPEVGRRSGELSDLRVAAKWGFHMGPSACGLTRASTGFECYGAASPLSAEHARRRSEREPLTPRGREPHPRRRRHGRLRRPVRPARPSVGPRPRPARKAPGRLGRRGAGPGARSTGAAACTVRMVAATPCESYTSRQELHMFA